MVQRNGYNATAFDIDGRVILSEHYTSKVAVRKVAREFLTYSNVKTVDVDNAKYGDCGEIIERYVKVGARSGLVIVDGVTRMVRF